MLRRLTTQMAAVNPEYALAWARVVLDPSVLGVGATRTFMTNTMDLYMPACSSSSTGCPSARS